LSRVNGGAKLTVASDGRVNSTRCSNAFIHQLSSESFLENCLLGVLQLSSDSAHTGRTACQECQNKQGWSVSCFTRTNIWTNMVQWV